MNADSLKQLLDACFVAKRIVETLPELPRGMKPRHIHVLDTIYGVCETRSQCRVGDVSLALNITMPSITKLIGELEALEMLEKYGDREDKRVTLLRLTSKGEACVKKHVQDFQKQWAECLEGISDEKVQEAVEIIWRLRDTMPGIGSSVGQQT